MTYTKEQIVNLKEVIKHDGICQHLITCNKCPIHIIVSPACLPEDALSEAKKLLTLIKTEIFKAIEML